MQREQVTIDGNEAAAYVAFKTNEIIAVYPITPSSPMGEWSDQWSSEGKPNIWGSIPEAGGRYLRVILLEDGVTVHNAFFDRNFRP